MVRLHLILRRHLPHQNPRNQRLHSNPPPLTSSGQRRWPYPRLKTSTCKTDSARISKGTSIPAPIKLSGSVPRMERGSGIGWGATALTSYCCYIDRSYSAALRRGGASPRGSEGKSRPRRAPTAAQTEFPRRSAAGPRTSGDVTMMEGALSRHPARETG